jgi:hypothetical protein
MNRSLGKKMVQQGGSIPITGSKGHRYVFSTGENSAMAGRAGGTALAQLPHSDDRNALFMRVSFFFSHYVPFRARS